MINDEANNCYYFAVNIFLELSSLGWLWGKKTITNNNNNADNDFQNALDDALNFQTIEKTHKEYQNESLILISIIGKGYIFQHNQKNGKNLNEIIRKLHLMYHIYHIIQKQ